MKTVIYTDMAELFRLYNIMKLNVSKIENYEKRTFNMLITQEQKGINAIVSLV
jgi:hypothetical protein